MEFDSCTPYYGFINAEFVQWWLTRAGHLVISTQGGNHLYIGKEKWHYKRALIAADKILFKFPYDGSVFAMEIKLCPGRERKANDETFRAGKNGPLNLPFRRFSEIFQPGHEMVDPDKCWPFEPPGNESARNIAKTAISLAANARGLPVLATTGSLLRGSTCAWMDVFVAIHTYAFVTNSLESGDMEPINRALQDEFAALGFCTVWASFFELCLLLIEMRKRSGTIDVYAMGSWALSKAAYGSVFYPRDKASEDKKEAVGTELRDYLALTATALVSGGAIDWAHQ